MAQKVGRLVEAKEQLQVVDLVVEMVQTGETRMVVLLDTIKVLIVQEEQQDGVMMEVSISKMNEKEVEVLVGVVAPTEMQHLMVDTATETEEVVEVIVAQEPASTAKPYVVTWLETAHSQKKREMTMVLAVNLKEEQVEAEVVAAVDKIVVQELVSTAKPYVDIWLEIAHFLKKKEKEVVVIEMMELDTKGKGMMTLVVILDRKILNQIGRRMMMPVVKEMPGVMTTKEEDSITMMEASEVTKTLLVVGVTTT